MGSDDREYLQNLQQGADVEPASGLSSGLIVAMVVIIIALMTSFGYFMYRRFRNNDIQISVEDRELEQQQQEVLLPKDDSF